METYQKKLNHILPSFLTVTFSTVVGIALLRWIVSIQFPLIDIKEEVWEIWIPLVFPWIPILIWLRPRFRVLTFKKETDNRRFFFQMISWGVMTAMLIVSQNYLTTATGELQVLKNIKEIDQFKKARYYRIDDFEVALDYGGSHTDFRTSGKYNNYLNFDIYFVCPILKSSSEELSNAMYNWYGIKYHEQVSNRLSPEEKESKYDAFYKDCVKKVEAFKFKQLDHFERQPTSDDKLNYFKAIQARIIEEPDDRYNILVPVQDAFEERNGNKFAWIFGSFGIGFAVFLLFLIWPGFSESEKKRFEKGKKPKNDDLVDALKFLVPKDYHFITSIILDLNILVFLAMVISGIHIISPNGQELLEWGANRRYETTSGEWWRLLTSMFLHGGIMHLFLNVYGLILAALFVEPILGRKKFAALYLIAGLCGSLASIWWYPNTISVGASGAIFGLYGAVLALLLTDAFPQGGKRGMLLMFGVFVALNLLMGMVGGIDNAAHIGGLLSGAVLGVLFHTLNKQTKTSHNTSHKK